MNFSGFLARCIQAGLNNNYPDGLRYPSIDIREGLAQDLPSGPRRDCKVMVAAQYILLAGRMIAEDCLKKPVKGFGLDEWRHWAERLEAISRQEEGVNPGLASATTEAHQFMLSLLAENLGAASQDSADQALPKPPEQREGKPGMS